MNDDDKLMLIIAANADHDADDSCDNDSGNGNSICM
jgi:hypothetical protein